MRRARKKSLANATALAAGSSALKPRVGSVGTGLTFKFFGTKRSGQTKLKDRDLVFILRNLATLTASGVPLPKALSTLAAEKALEKHSEMLNSVRRKLENGEAFSTALADFGDTFDAVMVNQIKVGEHAGTLGETLTTVARHREDSHRLRSEIVRKLAYPLMLVVMGSGVITFLLTYVVPVFKKTYDDAHVVLPLITRILIAVGAFAKGYGLIILGLLATSVFAMKQLRKRSDLAYKMDATLLRAPIIGHWLRDIAVLQLMEILGSLMEAGYNLSEALGEAGTTTSNTRL